jgi:hypothetical protein
MKKNFVATKLTGDDPPTAAENLKLLLSVDANGYSETFRRLKCVVGVLNRVIAADNDYWPTQRLGHWPPKARWALFSTKLEQVGHVDAPVAIVSDKFCSLPITGKPNPPVGAI